jgi:hypothetical protein
MLAICTSGRCPCDKRRHVPGRDVPGPCHGRPVDRSAAITVSDEFADRRWMAVHRFRAVTPAESGVGQPCPAMRVAAPITLFGAAQAAKTGDHLAAQIGGDARLI